jgi:rubredoxin
MERYKCSICGYVYDPEEGDTSSGIEPGTPFSDLPSDYICPVCAAGKDEFFVND